MAVDPRLPVLVGVGFASQRVDDPTRGTHVLELMARAARAAGDDTGAPGILAAVERMLVPRGTWSHRAPGRYVASRIGADRAHPVRAELGVPQQSLINDALAAVARGDVAVAMIVGGEARHREVMARRSGVTPVEADETSLEPDEQWPLESGDELVTGAEREAGVVLPMQQYALIENALGHAEGRTLDERMDEIAELWSRFDRVAGHNPRAAFAAARSPDLLRRPGPGNQPMAFPYNKWHITQMNVDQAVALLCCSVDAARGHGIEPGRWVHPHVAVESTHAVSLSRRRAMHRWPAMRVLGQAASDHLGLSLADIEHAELYSCFPIAVRVQQRELGLPLDGTPTVTGGMAFAGGPLNSFVLHATGEMACHLRSRPGDRGMVGAVSGLLTKPGLSVWSTRPASRPTLVADLAKEASAVTESVESVVGYAGPATIATYTVSYEGDTPSRVIVVGDTPNGTRVVASAPDPDFAARAIRDDVVGTPIRVEGTTFRT